MRLQAVRKAWEKFFFAPQSPHAHCAVPYSLWRLRLSYPDPAARRLAGLVWRACLGVSGDDENARTRYPSRPVRASAPG